ncbi:peptide/nickel transport system ATP-binding protein [Pararhizobium capsulatum DSM 1112]|uniref:Peptide/nickel transport system ATP-binding protein n=1 Tax=Pararhizobium capsulatum DSM 1112 TaxID=1121113 RepID=A0ABU0BYN8_9HYPH|nr:ABC transporter ATP-binding protein [Pararhizobium capsulatum]MDQ0323369.1 peptide/nickel transport system ATP-binding protein [Pararhizobium capsulatum DSM 1112]
MTKPLLEIQNLSIGSTNTSGASSIVADISFSLEKGKVLGLIGESGAGKSTLGLAALGYVRPGLAIKSGAILFDGVSLLSLSDDDRRRLRGNRITYVAQSAGASFNPAYRLREQITESSIRSGLASPDQANARANELMHLLGLPDPIRFGDKFPHQVSGGQLQRAMTAMALCSSPDLVVLDEPTTALDVTTQIEVLKAIRDAINYAGAAALYISHDLAVVTQIADEIMVLRHGKSVEHGPVAGIVQEPAHEYTRKLVAASRLERQSQPGLDASVLAVSGITAAYADGRPVLTDISLEIRVGETAALVGESGSGKSTLGRVINGLLPPLKGTVRFKGEHVHARTAKRSFEQRRLLQTIHQMPDTALNPRHSVEEIVGRPVTLYEGLRGDSRRRRVNELLAQVELDPSLANRYPRSLSGGQKQRVCIARALAARPHLIICDEPTSALDPLVAKDILALLLRLQRESGIAYLFITHDLNIVRSIATRVTILHVGKVVRWGETEEVLSPPFDPYTERLVNAVPKIEVGWLGRHEKGGRKKHPQASELG